MKNLFILLSINLFLVLTIYSCGEDSDLKKGKELLELGDYNKAIEFFNKAIENDPQNFNAHYNLAKTYDLINNKSKAYKEYIYAFKLDSTHNELLMSFGNFLYKQNLQKEAYNLFYKLLESSRDQKYIVWCTPFLGQLLP